MTVTKKDTKTIVVRQEKSVYDELRLNDSGEAVIRIVDSKGILRQFALSQERSTGKLGRQEIGIDATAIVRDNSKTGARVVVAEESAVSGNANLDGEITVMGYSRIGGNANLRGVMSIEDNTEISGDFELIGMGGNIVIRHKGQHLYTVRGRSLVGDTKITEKSVIFDSKHEVTKMSNLRRS